MNTMVMTPAKAFVRIVLGLAVSAAGLFVAGADAAPGAAVAGMLLMAAGIVLAARAARLWLPMWAARTAQAVGVAFAGGTAVLIHTAVVSMPLFPQPQDVPSVVESAPSPQYAVAVERARQLVRASMVEQNVPGVSVAVGAGGTVVWAEAFGLRDVVTRAPVTPDTRFNIGTAAAAVSASVGPLGLAHTGTEPVAAWSPNHRGEPEEDFPLFTLIRHVVFRPIGLAPDRPLPGNRATSYVPAAGGNPGRGRHEMYMRDMACCANGMAFFSTPSDLVRFAFATGRENLNGALAGGMVMSLVAVRERGFVAAITANIAHAKTPSLALGVAGAFAADLR